jgi:putative endonuclease
MFWVYILQNPAGRVYIGQTDDVDRRLREHNDPQLGLGKYTHKNGPWSLVWKEGHENI